MPAQCELKRNRSPRPRSSPRARAPTPERMPTQTYQVHEQPLVLLGGGRAASRPGPKASAQVPCLSRKVDFGDPDPIRRIVSGPAASVSQASSAPETKISSKSEPSTSIERPQFGRCWPIPGQVWSSSVEVAQSLAKVGSKSAGVKRARPEFGQNSARPRIGLGDIVGNRAAHANDSPAKLPTRQRGRDFGGRSRFRERLVSGEVPADQAAGRPTPSSPLKAIELPLRTPSLTRKAHASQRSCPMQS